MRSYAQSLALYERALKVTPTGAQTASKAPGRVGPIGAFPLYLQYASGSKVIDVDDNQFCDFFNGNCAVTLGHGFKTNDWRDKGFEPPRVPLLSLPTQTEVEVAERLCEIIPCAESIRFVKTGSEATEAAIRLARMATGCDEIVVRQGSYHSWHSWFTAAKDTHLGVPEFYRDGVNVVSSWDEPWDINHSGNIAAIIFEPDHVGGAEEIAVVIARARAIGALVIADEMILGNRAARAGGQELYNFVPDLACYGKAYANGYPLAFVCGRRDLMQHAWAVSGTFGGESISLAACQSVLAAYEMGYPIERMRHVGQTLIDAVSGVTARLGLPLSIGGYPQRPVLTWALTGEAKDVAVALLQQELAEQGILCHPSGLNVSAAHDADAVDFSLRAFTLALTAVAGYLSDKEPKANLRGAVLAPPFARPAA